MTKGFITIDTELSLGSFQRGLDLETNFARSILGRCSEGDFGIGYQIERFNAYGLKAIFFVDPMPAALFGLDMLRRTITPILEGGHEVQLHIHTEWLPFLERSPVGDRQGRRIRFFDLEDQVRLIEFAADLLIEAGAPAPIGFRAGNYGADDNTLRALAANDIDYDSSFNASCLGGACTIGLSAHQLDIVEHLGVIEVPISVITEWGKKLRHAQLCALSSWEMESGLRAAIRQEQSCFTIVLHSFELLTRDRLRTNRTNVDRFERLCALLADLRDVVPTIGFADRPQPQPGAAARPLAGNPLRTAHRMAEQLLSDWRYEKSARIA